MPMFKVFVTATTWNKPAMIEADDPDDAREEARDRWDDGAFTPVDCELRFKIETPDGRTLPESDGE